MHMKNKLLMCVLLLFLVPSSNYLYHSLIYSFFIHSSTLFLSLFINNLPPHFLLR